MKRLVSLLVVVVVAAAVAGCGTTSQYALLGTGIGAAAGAAGGALIGGVHGAKVGAVVGGGLGGLLGYGRGAEIEQQQAAAAAAAAAAAPQEACQWYYDHTGRYQWSCQGSERRYRATGTPVQPLPPPEKLVPMGVGAVAPAAPAPPPPPAPPAPQTWQERMRGQTAYPYPFRIRY